MENWTSIKHKLNDNTVEIVAEAVHKIWMVEAKRQSSMSPHQKPYKELGESVKDYGRALAIALLSVAEEYDGGTKACLECFVEYARDLK